jgi:hypothetical protein
VAVVAGGFFSCVTSLASGGLQEHTWHGLVYGSNSAVNMHMLSNNAAQALLLIGRQQPSLKRQLL